jgi:mRNA interferase HigB
MRILALSTLAAYWAKHPETEASLKHWYEVASAASWTCSNDVMLSFPKATVLNAERVRFEVAGGNYRMIVAFKYRSQVSFVKFLGTHKEYDQIDNVETVSQF